MVSKISVKLKDALRCGLLMYEFVHKHSNPINQGCNKNTLGRKVTVGIDIDGEENGVGEERNTADSREQWFVRMKNIKIFSDADRLSEVPEIVENHGQHGSENAEQ